MFSLKPLSAAILIVLSAQAMAANSISNQTQDGTENIADVLQIQASASTTTQNQTGTGNDVAAKQHLASSTIEQTQNGDYNASYAEQIDDNNSTISVTQA